MSRTRLQLARAVLVVLPVSIAAGASRAAEYHVATTGDDGHAGTSDAPFKTLARGVSVLKPGDTLTVAAGTYLGSRQLQNIPSGASWEKPVTIKGAPGKRPVIVAEPGQTVVYLMGNHHIVIDGFVVDARGGHDGIKITYGTGVPQSHHIRVRDTEVKNAKNQGLLVSGEGNEFLNLDVHDNGETGFHHGIYLSADRNLIDGGKYYRNAGWGIHVYPKATHTTVRNTRCFDNKATGLGLVWGSNNVAYNNVVYGNGSGIHLSGISPRCYNNTVYGNRGEGISVANAGNGASGTRDADVRNNLVHGNESGIADYAKGAGTVLANNFTGDPDFVDAPAGDFRLGEGSPAIDRGADLRDRGVTSDADGAPRPQGKAFDVGAYEFLPERQQARGPLKVHPDNPRYFTDGTGRSVYLTGSHTWNVLNDPDPAKSPPFEYEGYLDLLQRHNHNFFRLWARMGTGGGPPVPLPTIYARTGPGKAQDGLPKYDLNRFNDAFFRRLRERVKAAGDRGIYVAVMFFGGDNVVDVGGNPNWPLHPYHKANNVNGMNGDPNGDGQGTECYRLEVPAITALQEAYVKKVVDAVGDLDNVVWEVGNELPATLDFQNHVVRVVKEHERTRPKQHPVGISTFAGAEPPMKDFGDTPADWVTPDQSSGGDYQADPPAADGKKVIISDTDHLWGVGGDAKWVWKSFTRGLNPIYMDPLDDDPTREGARRAMGQTRRFAERMNLAAMKPAGEAASTKYCLARPGREYVVFLPEGGPVTVDLGAAKGELSVEWFSPGNDKTTAAAPAAGGAKREFAAPFTGPAVLYLKSRNRD